MAKYEYEIAIGEDGKQHPQRKELVLLRVDNSVRVKVRGSADNEAVVIFWGDGQVRLYETNAQKAGFDPYPKEGS